MKYNPNDTPHLHKERAYSNRGKTDDHEALYKYVQKIIVSI
jgi:hypothetical protein